MRDMEQVVGYIASVAGPLILVGLALMLAGLMGRVGTGSLSLKDLDNEVMASLGLLIIFCIVVATVSSDELATAFDAMAGGIPIVEEIADYGSYRNVLNENPGAAVTAFLDTFIMCVLMNLLKFLPPMITGGTMGSRGLMSRLIVKAFGGVVCGLVALLLLNYVIKGSGSYQMVVAGIGGLLATVTTISIPALVVAVLSSRGKVVSTAVAAGLLAGYIAFSKSFPMTVLRGALFQAIAFFACIYALEGFYGSLGGAAVLASNVAVAFGPVFVMIVGLCFVVGAVLKK